MKLIFILGMAALSLVSVRSVAEGACAYNEISVFDCEVGNAKASLCVSSETGLPGYRNVSMRGKFFSISEKKDSERLIFFINNVPYAGGMKRISGLTIETTPILFMIGQSRPTTARSRQLGSWFIVAKRG